MNAPLFFSFCRQFNDDSDITYTGPPYQNLIAIALILHLKYCWNDQPALQADNKTLQIKDATFANKPNLLIGSLTQSMETKWLTTQ